MNLIDAAISRIRNAADRFKPKHIVALFSGGHDSATASLIAHEAGADITLHINTGIGVEQTRNYVRDISSQRDWNLMEYKAEENTKADGTPDPQIYRELVLDQGFPGPGMHRKMYNRLKERNLSRFERDMGATPKHPILYIGGMRTSESTRRMLNMKRDEETGLTVSGRKIFLAPIHDFRKSDCNFCMEVCGLRRNEVVDLIHKSGECLCGAFAKHGEFEELKMWFPETAKQIEDLEKEVMPRFPWRWGSKAPQWWKDERAGQMSLFDQPLCHNCNFR